MDADREPPVRRVPYPFAKMHGALLLEVSAERAVVCLRQGARPQVLAELRRVLGVPLRVATMRFQCAFQTASRESHA